MAKCVLLVKVTIKNIKAIFERTPGGTFVKSECKKKQYAIVPILIIGNAHGLEDTRMLAFKGISSEILYAFMSRYGAHICEVAIMPGLYEKNFDPLMVDVAPNSWFYNAEKCKFKFRYKFAQKRGRNL